MEGEGIVNQKRFPTPDSADEEASAAEVVNENVPVVAPPLATVIGRKFTFREFPAFVIPVTFTNSLTAGILFPAGIEYVSVATPDVTELFVIVMFCE